MAKKKTVVDEDVKSKNQEEEFEDTIETEEDNDEENTSENEDDAILGRLLADPTEAVKMIQEDQDETEEVLYCPNCGVTGLFVDNICMNCGVKKSKKSFENSEEVDDEIIDFDLEEPINLEEF